MILELYSNEDGDYFVKMRLNGKLFNFNKENDFVSLDSFT